MGRKTVKPTGPGRAPGRLRIAGKQWRLAKQVAYIQRRAAAHDGRFVTVGPLALFSTDTAWLLDPSELLATRLARDGDPQSIYIEETDTNFAIGWEGHYRIEGPAFLYIDHHSRRVLAILGYPVEQIAQLR
jgi:hypothetical protein